MSRSDTSAATESATRPAPEIPDNGNNFSATTPQRHCTPYAIPNETVTKILNYIDENITDPLNADLIAAEFFVSKSWLSHNFKKYLNTSLKKYINQKKLLYIERLVIAGIPIVKAAESCSYTNYTTFFRQYKQYTNKKPRETKQSLKS